jgi:hypothetical protein
MVTLLIRHIIYCVTYILLGFLLEIVSLILLLPPASYIG